MAQIALLNQETIDKIAAGEVVERPCSVVKELVENAIDAGSTAITVEIKEGGISLVRITDNGSGIEKDQVPLAFLRHSTSKIRSAEDLMCVKSLGFRGEALSSISAVARVELITKTYDALTGTRYVIEGSKEMANEDVGAPDGTTFLVKDLFYNTPARRKFLKTPQTEGNYISDMVEKLALSHPDISFKFINNNQTKLHTSGNGNIKDLIYHIYGREIAASLLKVDFECKHFKVNGFIGKPVITRGNRNYENYFINGRYIKSSLLAKAIEEAYKSFLMQHQYPFTVLYFTFLGDTLDVNVHPTKMELRFGDNIEVYKELMEGIYNVLSHKEFIPEVPVTEEKPKKDFRQYKEPIPEPFEKRRINDIRKASFNNKFDSVKDDSVKENSNYVANRVAEEKSLNKISRNDLENHNAQIRKNDYNTSVVNMNLPSNDKSDTKNIAKSDANIHVSQDVKKNEFDVNDFDVNKVNNSENTSFEDKNIDYKNIEGKNKEYKENKYAEDRVIVDKISINEDIKSTDKFNTDNISSKTENRQIFNDDQVVSQIDIEQDVQQVRFQEYDQVQNAPGTLEEITPQKSSKYDNITLGSISPEFLSHEAKTRHKVIGQLFKTYWLIEYEDKLFILDQHAAHEKVLYEKTMAKLKEKEFTSQTISPPIVMSLDAKETEMLEKYRQQIEMLGYEVEHFGGKEYMINAIPDNLYHIDMKELFIEMLDDFSNISGKETPELILEKVASMSCKAAVKGNNALTLPEIDALIEELLTLDNPYNCPHGRPTIISMTKYEIEKKFKRIV